MDKKLENKIFWGEKKRKWLFAFFDYKNSTNRGANWIGYVETFIPVHKILDYAILLFGIDSIIKERSIGFIIFGGLCYLLLQILSESFKWFLGHIDYKKGIWKMEIEWSQKNEKYNPVFHETKKTLENIAEKVGAESGYQPL
jgi:hypothetical protein